MYAVRYCLSVIFTGLIAGLLGVLLGWLIDFFVSVFFGVEAGIGFVETLLSLSPIVRVLIPTLGGIIVGMLIYYAKVPEIAGEGVPMVKEVLQRGTTIRYRTAPLKLLATSITLGTGGSAGREGPIIQIGAATGVSLGRLFRIDGYDRTLLLLAGAAGAMASAFGTPAAALVFVVEVLRRQIEYRGVLVLVSTVVVASGTARLGFGYVGLSLPKLPVAPFSVPDVPLYIIVGLAAALLAVLFTVMLRSAHSLFNRYVSSLLVRPAIGGLCVGLIAVLVPYVHEPGMQAVFTGILNQSFPLVVLLAILGAKMVATAITVGSGGSGGIFAPSLFIGFTLGGVVSLIGGYMGMVVPTSIVYLSMAAVFGAAAHAPLTAMFIIYELVGNVEVIPSLVISVLVAYIAARFILPYSMYSSADSK